MKLLLLYTKNTNEVFNRKSAIGSYINCLGDILNSKNIEVYLNGVSYNDLNDKELSPKTITKSRLSFIKKIIPNVFKRYIKDRNHIKSLTFFKDKLLGSSQSYDAILEFYNLGSDIGITLAKKQNIPLYITYDGPIIEEYNFFYGANPFGYNEILRRQKESLIYASKIVVYSNPMKAFIKNITGVEDNVYTHQNIDFTRFDIQKEENILNKEVINICFIGSFLKWHQVDLLINSFKHLIEKKFNVELFLVGDGQERISIQNNVNNLPESIKSKIRFTGFLDGKELLELKKQMHIGVMPGSNWYGAPNKIFEYGAMKMAVLAPDTPTICDLFNDNEIDIFEWRNSEDLSLKLEDLCKDKEVLQHKGQKLFEIVTQRYSEKTTGKFYLELLK